MSSKYKPFGSNKPTSLNLMPLNRNNGQVSNNPHTWSRNLWNQNDFVISETEKLKCLDFIFFFPDIHG